MHLLLQRVHNTNSELGEEEVGREGEAERPEEEEGLRAQVDTHSRLEIGQPTYSARGGFKAV